MSMSTLEDRAWALVEDVAVMEPSPYQEHGARARKLLERRDRRGVRGWLRRHERKLWWGILAASWVRQLVAGDVNWNTPTAVDYAVYAGLFALLVWMLVLSYRADRLIKRAYAEREDET